jgi:hypothetical protein
MYLRLTNCASDKSSNGEKHVFSVNTLFWKIRVTRVQQKIFDCEFSVPVRYFEPSRGHPVMTTVPY